MPAYTRKRIFLLACETGSTHPVNSTPCSPRAEVRLKKRVGGQLFEAGEAKTNGGHQNE